MLMGERRLFSIVNCLSNVVGETASPQGLNAGSAIRWISHTLLHYPFTSVFYDKVREAAATKRYGYLTSDEYDLYWARLSREPRLSLRLDTARRYAGVEFLIDEGFLVASPDYLDWGRAQRNGQGVFKSYFARTRMNIRSIRASRLQIRSP
jgi:hypothetical protein